MYSEDFCVRIFLEELKMTTTFEQYPERFLNYLTVEKACSELTVTNYRKDLACFAEFWRQRAKGEALWERVSPLDVRAYLAYLNEKQYARYK